MQKDKKGHDWHSWIYANTLGHNCHFIANFQHHGNKDAIVGPMHKNIGDTFSIPGQIHRT